MLNWNNKSNGSWNKYAFQSVNNSVYPVNKQRLSKSIFFNEEEETHNLAITEQQRIEVKAHYRKRTRLTTDKLPEELPVEIIEHKLPEKECICPECGSELHTMGKETRDELKIIPAKAVIVRHIRHVYSCRNCEKTSDHTSDCKGRYT